MNYFLKPNTMSLFYPQPVNEDIKQKQHAVYTLLKSNGIMCTEGRDGFIVVSRRNMKAVYDLCNYEHYYFYL